MNLVLALQLSLLVFSYLTVRLTLPLFLGMLDRADLVRPNYRGDTIPVAAGIALIAVPAFWLTVALFCGLVLPWQIVEPWQGLSVIMLLFSFGLTGFMDDTIGSREQTGLKGHFRALILRGQLTTGAFKALFGGLTAMAFALAGAHFMPDTPWWMVILNALIVAFSANALNIFDLRPGRAGKVFIFIAAVIFLVGRFPEAVVLLFPAFGALVAFMPVDLGARAMMGDAGSNPLGAVLGVFAVFSFGVLGKIVYLLLLLGLHGLAEFASISALIERSAFLKFLDQWGRRERP